MHVLALRLSIAGDAPASPKGQYLVDLEAAATLHPRKLFAEGKRKGMSISAIRKHLQELCQHGQRQAMEALDSLLLVESCRIM